jgi:hypothetical protein
MAFDKDNFAASGHKNDNIVNLYCYTTTDATATVDSAQYFNDLVDVLNVGDIILAKTSNQTGFYEVLSNDGTDVDVSDMADDIGNADTD